MMRNKAGLDKKDLWIVIFLFISSILIQLYFLNPPVMSDQLEYYITAVRFPRLPNPPNIASMRLGVILPVAVLYRIFGQSEAAYYIFPLLTAAIFAISIYLIGRALFNNLVGIFAALWILLMPQILLESGHLLPDMPEAAFFTAGIALIICAQSLSKEKKSRKMRCWPYFIGGLLLGWAYLCKEYIAVLFALLPLLFWALKIPYKYLIPTAIGMLLMLGLEMSMGWVYYRNPLIRFLAAKPRDTAGFIETDIWKTFNLLLILVKRRGGIGTFILLIAAFIGSIFYSLKNNRGFTFLLAWMLLFYLFFVLMGLLPLILSWEGIVLLRLHKFRYWIPILPPIVIAGVAVLDPVIKHLFKTIKLQQEKARTASSAVIAVCLLLTAWIGIGYIKDSPNFIRNGSDHFLELRDFLRNNNQDVEVIWVSRDSRRATARVLPIYSRTFWGKPIWEGTIKYLNTGLQYLRAEEIDSGHVVINRDFNNPEIFAVPEYLSKTPENWRLVFESENQKIGLYAVNQAEGNQE